MTEKITSCGLVNDVEIFWQRDEIGLLKGMVFSADGMLVTARHVVESLPKDFHGFDIFPLFDNREIDIAVKKDLSVKGLEFGFSNESVLENCLCITSAVDAPDHLFRIPGRFIPFMDPTYLHEFVPYCEEDRSYFEPGCSGSVVIKGGKIVGLIKACNDSHSIIVGLCFSYPPLREQLTDQLGMNFVEMVEDSKDS